MSAALKLSVAAAICSLLLASLAGATREQIAENEQRYQQSLLLDLVPPGMTLEVNAGQGYSIIDANNVVSGALVARQTNAGYNGRIKFWLAVDATQRVTGIRVTWHQETPGLGDPIDHQVSDWSDQFIGADLQNSSWVTRRGSTGFDMLSGATITSRAMINAVHDGLQELATNE